MVKKGITATRIYFWGDMEASNTLKCNVEII